MLDSHPGTVSAELRPISMDESDRVFRKVAWRIIPFIFLIFVLAMVDRINIGYAKLQFSHDLTFSDTVYGMGAGVFFIGYMLSDVPSNMLLHKRGARATISRIMILWGIISASMMFISSSTQFYVFRFALGLAEGGLFPGVFLYLTYWFSTDRRARMLALPLAAIPVAGVIGAPLSGYLLDTMHNVNGLRGWQWMFLIEGIPSVIVGVIAYFFLENSPRNAKWLSCRDKQIIANMLEFDITKPDVSKSRANMRHALTSPIFLVLIVLQAIGGVANSGFSFWLPQIIHDLGVTNLRANGVVTSIPYLCAGIGMYVWGYSSDRNRERRWHYAVAAILGATGLLITCAHTDQLSIAVAGLSLAYVGTLSCTCVFWAYSTTYLKNGAAVIGIAFINSVASLVTYGSLSLFGAIRTATHSTTLGLYIIAALMFFAAALVFCLPKHIQKEN
ncbi:MFS transporter [Caballeronia sordidicola]|uniref:MFS transporter n=1 Tax=Caballeronia sordidicola TaxID=196367 RepID=UPI0004D014ED|nr:MFS transporter [Caballeronia sordidicola]